MSALSEPRLRHLLADRDPSALARLGPILLLEESPSTNDHALAAAGPGAEGMVVAAGTQSRGKGRLGRRWSSPSGNLYVSFLRRIVEPPEKAALVSLLAGIALAETVAESAGIEASLKWPNDLLVNGRKLAGILLEARLPWQVVGVGLNVNAEVARLSPEVHDLATTLCVESGREHDLNGLLAEFLARFIRLEADFVREPRLPLDRYLRYFPYVGTRVRIERSDGTFVAPITGVGEDGALLLADAAGATLRVTTGEVTHVRAQE